MKSFNLFGILAIAFLIGQPIIFGEMISGKMTRTNSANGAVEVRLAPSSGSAGASSLAERTALTASETVEKEKLKNAPGFDEDR